MHSGSSAEMAAQLPQVQRGEGRSGAHGSPDHGKGSGIRSDPSRTSAPDRDGLGSGEGTCCPLGEARPGSAGSPQGAAAKPPSYRQSGAQGSRNWWDQSRNPRRGQRGRDPTDEDLRDLVKHLGRLVLRLEDNQAIASLDTQFLMFMSTAEDAKGWSLTSSLYRVAESWHKQKESDPGSLS